MSCHCMHVTVRAAAFCASILLGVPLSILAADSSSSNRLPSTIVRGNVAAPEHPTRGWSIRDIVEISSITGVAAAQNPQQVGFVIRQPSLDTGTITYGLYVVDVDGLAPARKILEAPYIAQLSRDPNEHAWTVLADLGSGVQLYDIDDNGASTPLIVNEQTVMIGTSDGVILTVYEPHPCGIISYQWAPDGTSLWYSRPRVRSTAALESLLDHGIPFDNRTMSPSTFRGHAAELLGAELHIVKRSPPSDRTVAFVPSSPSTNVSMLRREFGTVYWAQDSQHVVYTAHSWAEDGKEVRSQFSVDVDSGGLGQIAPSLNITLAVPTGDGANYLSVSRTPDGASHLAEYGADGKQISAGATVLFHYVGPIDGWGAWRDAWTHSEILAARYADHYGLIRIPESAASRVWSTVTDNISHCSFAKDLSFGACVRDNFTLAPELVRVDANTGAFSILARPNARYDAITPLRSEHTIWKNRYGHQSDGYITYPRDFSSTRKYPAVVVTHGAGARNEFVDRGFQAEIPVQALAEAGYVVLSVNEVPASLRTRTYLQDRGMRAARRAIAQTQFSVITDPVATMEAALADVIHRGIVDPNKAGIAGYSRGAEVTLYAMTQSKMFHAASVGDGASNTNADGYWSWGSLGSAAWYTSIYGGSAYDTDPQVRGNYRQFSPTFRSNVFAGALLEQCTANQATYGLERLAMLRQAGIPMELDFFPNESHLFWHPRHVAAAMQRTLDWFDYWLLGEKDSDPSKTEQYARWQAMADTFKAQHPNISNPRSATAAGP
jgi:dipeptidyl aminopeptidase/acylaminoacyl peptidase